MDQLTVKVEQVEMVTSFSMMDAIADFLRLDATNGDASMDTVRLRGLATIPNHRRGYSTFRGTSKIHFTGGFSMSMDREELHRLIDQLPENEVTPALRYLQYLRDVDPVRKSLDAAPLDDEPETDEELLGAEEAMADIRAGRKMSTEELKRKLEL